MEYRTLGRTGVQVSSLGFGTMSFGGDADETTAAAMFNRCRDAGINFFDCANVYNKGRSEEILGRLIAAAGCREEVVISSKVNFPMTSDANGRGSSRRHIVRQVEGSLKRLGTGWIDLYFLHGWDAKTPMDESLRALDDLVHQGKILYAGVSNWAAWQIAKALGISALKNLARFECIQPMYSLVKRQVEVEVLPLAQSEQVGVITYSPLGGGLLTGKFGVGRRPESGRLTANKLYQTRYGDEINFEVADRLTAYAASRDTHPATLAVAWVMSHPAITAPIVGARNLEQLEPSLKAAELKMTPEWRAELSALTPEPPSATDRSEEKKGVTYQGALAR
jgi:aryl-alcohol dehydrogenase-like predicted oxidoreductase